MRSRVLCILLGLAMGWTGAGTPAGAADLYKRSKGPDQTRAPYTTNRYIALQRGTGNCPDPGKGWTVERLPELVESRRRKEDADNDSHKQVYDPYGNLRPTTVEKGQDKKSAKLNALIHKHGLDRICVYTAEASAPSFSQARPAGLVRADPDRMALIPSAPAELGAIGDQTWPALADKFLDQAGKVRLPPTSAPSVRIVFIDTHPTGEGPPNPPVPTTARPYPSWHGHGMANLGNEMVCGYDVEWQNCPIRVATRLALRYDRYTGPDMTLSPDSGSPEGGHLGLVSELGTAILEELDNWQKNYPGTKLILNLSVGWDGEFSDLDARRVATLETSAQTVYRAVRTATDLGALVIASAGNRTGGRVSTEPLLPAAWELRPPSWLPFFTPDTVYAVGGVDWQDLPLPNSRPGGKPERVAYGDHAVARTRASGSLGPGAAEPTKMFTGTSVSAAVVSSIAAVAWYLRPGMDPSQVMKLIDGAGTVISGQAADFYAGSLFPSTGPPMKRLSLCPTVLEICPVGSPCHAKLKTLACKSEHIAAQLKDIQPVPPIVVPFTLITPPPCTSVFKGSGAISPPHGCPMEMLPDITDPYVVSTQPQANPCPACTAVPDPPLLHAQVAALALTPSLLAGETSETYPSYGVAVGLDPDWLKQARGEHTTIESAIFVVDCQTGPAIGERFDITSAVNKLYDAYPHNPKSVRLSFGQIGTRATLEGCTASVDFTLKLNGGAERSVQSPVYVDP